MEKNIKEYKKIFSESNFDLIVTDFQDIKNLFYQDITGDGVNGYILKPVYVISYSKDNKMLAYIETNDVVYFNDSVKILRSGSYNSFYIYSKHFLKAKRMGLECKVYLQDKSKIFIRLEKL